MTLRPALLAAACLLALSACGDDAAPVSPETAAPAAEAAPAVPDTAPTEVAVADPADADADADACSTTIEANDAMQFSTDELVVPSTCTEFTVTLEHVGQLPVTAMGHNVVITAAGDMQVVAADGMAAGPDNAYVKPGDPRVVAHTGLVGGGQQTSFTFDVAAVAGGEFVFFCSFPGHPAMMNGKVVVQ